MKLHRQDGALTNILVVRDLTINLIAAIRVGMRLPISRVIVVTLPVHLN